MNWIRSTRPKRDTWHFHKGCRHYQWLLKTRADDSVERRDVKPKSGELCDTCRSKSKKEAK